MLPDTTSEFSDELVVNDELREALAMLTDRERLILRRYFFEDFSLIEIAEQLGVSEARVCQIKMKAQRQLRGHVTP